MKPFFSVIIPTYNRSLVLKRAIGSVLDQTFSDYEILVMDDGSTDNTKAIVESFHDNRIYYSWSENSGGPATPRNRGIDAAQGKWLCFLDSDDLWYSNKLAIISQTIRSNPCIDLLCHNEYVCFEKTGKKLLHRSGPFETDYYKVMLMKGCRVSTSATVASSEFLNLNSLRFNQSRNYTIVEDYDMWLRIAYYGGRFCFVSDILSEYIIDADNITFDYEKNRSNHITLLKDHVYHLQKFSCNKDNLWSQIYARLLLVDCKYYIRNKKIAQALGFLFLAVGKSPVGCAKYILSRIVKRSDDYLYLYQNRI